MGISGFLLLSILERRLSSEPGSRAPAHTPLPFLPVPPTPRPERVRVCVRKRRGTVGESLYRTGQAPAHRRRWFGGALGEGKDLYTEGAGWEDTVKRAFRRMGSSSLAPEEASLGRNAWEGVRFDPAQSRMSGHPCRRLRGPE